MKIKNILHIDFAHYFVFLGAGLGGMYWFFQACIDAYLFDKGNFTDHFLSPDSQQIWMRTIVIFLMIISSFFVQIVLIKKKEIEDKLRQNEEIFRAAIESPINGILVIGSRGQVIHANSRFAELWRIPEELMETANDEKLLDFVLDQLQVPSAFIDKVQKLYRSPDDDIDKLLFKDGRVFERFSYPLMRAGVVSGRVWSFSDITEREKNVASLNLTQFSIDHAPEPVFWTNSEAKFIYVNENAVKTLGYTQDELLEMTVHDLDSNFSTETWQSNWEEVKRLGSVRFESYHTKKNGIIIPVEISLKYVKFKGNEFNCVYARDISARLKREEKFQKTISVLEARIAELESKPASRINT